MQEISTGIRQKWEYRVKYLGESEDDARKMTGETAQGEDFSLDGQFTGKNKNDQNPGTSGPNSAGSDD